MDIIGCPSGGWVVKTLELLPGVVYSKIYICIFFICRGIDYYISKNESELLSRRITQKEESYKPSKAHAGIIFNTSNIDVNTFPI